uniref:Uncharacterized protein n=1 Tax=viral metagenome TaxID=1070528 RepID=A0A6C0KDA7_9ZZZZ
MGNCIYEKHEYNEKMVDTELTDLRTLSPKAVTPDQVKSDTLIDAGIVDPDNNLQAIKITNDTNDTNETNDTNDIADSKPETDFEII